MLAVQHCREDNWTRIKNVYLKLEYISMHKDSENNISWCCLFFCRCTSGGRAFAPFGYVDFHHICIATCNNLLFFLCMVYGILTRVQAQIRVFESVSARVSVSVSMAESVYVYVYTHLRV